MGQVRLTQGVMHANQIPGSEVVEEGVPGVQEPLPPATAGTL